MTFGLRIRVDFNNRLADGSLLASLRRATGEFHEGDVVIAMQPGEDMERFARVISIDEATGRVLLEVNWDSDPSDWAPISSSAQRGVSPRLVVPGSVLYRITPMASAPFASGWATARQTVDH